MDTPFDDLIRALCDPENQPHQFVGKPDELLLLIAPRKASASMYTAGLRHINGRGTGWSVSDLYEVMTTEAARSSV